MLSKVFFITKMIEIVKREITITKSPHKPYVMDISVSLVILVTIKKFEIAPFIIRPTISGITFF